MGGHDFLGENWKFSEIGGGGDKTEGIQYTVNYMLVKLSYCLYLCPSPIQLGEQECREKTLEDVCGIVQISGIDLTLKIDVMECYVIVVRFVLDIWKVRKKRRKMLENMVHTIKNLVVSCVCSDGEERVVSVKVSIFKSIFP